MPIWLDNEAARGCWWDEMENYSACGIYGNWIYGIYGNWIYGAGILTERKTNSF